MLHVVQSIQRDIVGHRIDQTPSTGLRHPSSEEERAGNRCSECENLLVVRSGYWQSDTDVDNY